MNLILVFCSLLISGAVGIPKFHPRTYDEKILHGQEADPGQFKAYVAFKDIRLSSAYTYCGGSILSATVVLTSASCVEGFGGRNASLVELVAGSINATDTATAQRRSLMSVVVHEDYDPTKINNDIALAFIDELDPFVFSELVSNIRGLESRTEIPAGEVGQIPGFGITEDFVESDILLYSNLPVLDDKNCHKDYPQEISDTMFCAGYTGRDPCTGDEGGPFFCSGSATQCGIMSHQSGCGEEDYPTVFTRISSFRDWILNNTYSN